MTKYITQLRRISEYRAICLVLCFGFLYGLLYVFLIPPWQHYDEPGHLEYAWILANRPGIPKAGDYDQGVRRQIAISMIEHDFYPDPGSYPDLTVEDKPVWIGYSQIGDVPLYYMLVSLPLRLVRGSEVAFQLYVGRFVSLGLFLLTLLAAYAAMREITPPGHPLRILIPLSMTLIPGFVDLMTALNNDVGATAVLTVFLWLGMRTIRRGISWFGVLGLLITMVASVYTKGTAAGALPLGLLALLLGGLQSLRSRLRRPLSWTVIAIVLFLVFVITAAASFEWGGAKYWAKQGIFYEPAIAASYPQSRLGEHAFHLDPASGSSYLRLVQPIDAQTVESLQGKTVTIGAWIWINNPDGKPVTVQTPSLEVDGKWYNAPVEAGPEPIFFALPVDIPAEINRINVLLAPGAKARAASAVYYDGVTLVEGSFTVEEMPLYPDVDLETGIWAGQSITNLVRNPSAEQVRLRFRPWLATLISRAVKFDPSLIFLSFDDARQSFWYYRATLSSLIQTYWGRMGWGHIMIVVRGIRPYWALTFFSLGGILAGSIWMVTARRIVPWEQVLFLALTLLIVWGLTAMRGLHSLIGTIFIPSARYAYPAVLPTQLLVMGGWFFVWRWIAAFLEKRRPDLAKWTPFVGWTLYGFSFLILNFMAVWSIIRFYYR